MVASAHRLAPRSKIYDLRLSEEVPTHGVTLKVPDEKQVSVADLGFSEGGISYSIVHNAHVKKFCDRTHFG